MLHTRHGLHAVGRFLGRGFLAHVPEHVLHDLYLALLRGDDALGELLDLGAVGLLKDGLGHRYGGPVVGNMSLKNSTSASSGAASLKRSISSGVAMPGMGPLVG